MRLLHSSDLLVGLGFPHVERHADALRQQRLDVLQELLARAEAFEADAVLLAGNTLADNRILEREVLAVAGVLAATTVPVYLLPGQTDPYAPDSPFRLFPELFCPPVHVMDEAVPIPLENATLFPCPVRSRPGPLDPTGWIPPRQASHGLRVGIACAPKLGRLPDLDYLALGGRMGEEVAWSGSPEAADYGQGLGQVRLVTLEPGQPPRIQSVAVGRFFWEAHRLELTDTQPLKELFESCEDPSNILLRLELRGSVPLGELRELEDLLKRERERFFYLEVDHQVELSTPPDEAYRHPLLRSMVGSLTGQPSAAGRRALVRLIELVDRAQQPDLT